MRHLVLESRHGPLRVQEKILARVEYGEFERVGGTERCRWRSAWSAPPTPTCPAWRHRSVPPDLLDRLAFAC